MFRIITFLAFLALLTQSGIMAQVNYDESKIQAYDIPKLLVDDKGHEIMTAEDWEKNRRPFLHQLLENIVYGKFPGENIQVEFKLRSTHDIPSIAATLKNIDIMLSNGSRSIDIDLVIFLPKGQEGVPLFVGLNFFGNHTVHSSQDIAITQSWSMNKADFRITDNKATSESRGVRSSRWPVEKIIGRGYGLAVMYYGDIDPDFDDGFNNGIHQLLSPAQKNIKEGISSISAWAYGLSKAMDYFETDDDIDQNRVAVIGHSRLGKAALWAGANDERFAMVISNNSGCGGAALSRRRIGETVEVINTRFPHWFSKNYSQVNDKELEQEFDQHMLLSLMAPRPLYVASAKEDKWADPIGEFLSLFHTRGVYKLYGGETFDIKNTPPTDKPLITGSMGYHIRSGVHDLTAYDWEQYLDFADLHLTPVKQE